MSKFYDVTQEFKFISEIDDEYINKLVKRPHEIAVKYIKEPAEKNRFINLLANSIKDIFEGATNLVQQILKSLGK